MHVRCTERLHPFGLLSVCSVNIRPRVFFFCARWSVCVYLLPLGLSLLRKRGRCELQRARESFIFRAGGLGSASEDISLSLFLRARDVRVRT